MVRIHELLASGKFPNCSGMSDEMEVSYKTVQRDVDFMRDQLDLPIAYDQIRHGFFYTEPVSHFPMVTVSHGELVALLVAQKAIEQYRGTTFEKPLRSAFDKLVSSLEGEAGVSMHELTRAVSFRPQGIPQSEMKTFEVLSGAVMASEAVEFDYHALKADKAQRRRVEPYHLACINNQWYLIANDRARGDLRTFAVTRITKAKNLKQSFERPANFSISDMLAGSFAAFEAGKVETVRIRLDAFAARLVSERQWHSSQRLRRLDSGDSELTMKVGIAPDLEGWILGWGGHAEVLEPASLRERIAGAARAMSIRYASLFP